MPRWPGHMRGTRAAVLWDGHPCITMSPASALAKWREHQIEEVKASSGLRAIELLLTLRALPPNLPPRRRTRSATSKMPNFWSLVLGRA